MEGKKRASQLEEERRLKEMEGEGRQQNKDQHFKSACVKKSILHNRLWMREIARRAVIKESIM